MIVFFWSFIWSMELFDIICGGFLLLFAKRAEEWFVKEPASMLSLILELWLQ